MNNTWCFYVDVNSHTYDRLTVWFPWLLDEDQFLEHYCGWTVYKKDGFTLFAALYIDPKGVLIQ